MLIDECLNWRLGRALTGHFCTSVQRMGWSGIRNGELLEKIRQERFDVFLQAALAQFAEIASDLKR